MKHVIFAAATAAATLAGPALAQDLASGDQIVAAISGNTVQGDMSDGAAYTEFYAADGTIRGANYTGGWSVEGGQMCFDYGEGATCWSVGIDGDAVTWVRDGETQGTGTILPGNPNDF